jgi:hypothetical protein
MPEGVACEGGHRFSRGLDLRVSGGQASEDEIAKPVGVHFHAAIGSSCHLIRKLRAEAGYLASVRIVEQGTDGGRAHVEGEYR